MSFFVLCLLFTKSVFAWLSLAMRQYIEMSKPHIFFYSQNSCSGVCLPIYVSCFRLLLPQPPVCLSVALDYSTIHVCPIFLIYFCCRLGLSNIVIERFHVVAKWLICLIDYSTNWKLDICLGLVCHILQCTHTFIPITITTSSVFLVSSSPVSFFPLQPPFSLSRRGQKIPDKRSIILY